MKPGTNAGANGGTTRLPPGRQWKAHCGRRQRERVLLRSWARIEGMILHDASARAVRELLLDAVEDDPDPEYAVLHLGHAALLVADEQRIPWPAAVSEILTLHRRNASQDWETLPDGRPAWVLEAPPTGSAAVPPEPQR